MATDNLQALFGGTMLPQDMQQELINKRAREFATLTPSQQLGQMGYKAGAALGGGLAQAMGVDITDPQIKRMSQLQALTQGAESTPEGLKVLSKKLSDAGFAAEAAMAMDKAREAELTMAKTTSLVEDKQAAREQQLMLAREKIQSQIDIARERGATQLQIAQMMQDGRMQMAQLAAALKSEKPQVADDKAATRIGQNTVFENLITEGDTLKNVIDENKDSFSLGGRAATAVKSVMNPSASSVKAVSDVDSYLKKARNAYLLAAKGTQTEGDAQRAWEEFSGRLDFSSAEGAKRSVDRIKTELDTQRKSNEAYLQSRGISSGQSAKAGKVKKWSEL
jgi:hypothetical protein